MRLTILSFYSGQIERGVEVHVEELKKRLSTKVITTFIPIKPYSGTENTLLRRFYLDSISRQIFSQVKLVLKGLSLNPPDVLYPVNNGWQSILCKLFCLKHKTKLLLAGHSGPGWDDRVNLWLCPDAFIAFSQTQAKWARGITKKVPIHVIPHAVDLKQFQPGKSPINLPLEPPIFVSVSALSQQSRGGETHRNIDFTIKAVAQIKTGSLLLLGDGNDADRIDELGKKLLGTRYLRTSVSHNIIHQYYQAADVFTLASSASEAFGMAYLEALACNLPVVTIDDPLRREIIGKSGAFIKNLNNTEEYSRELTRALHTKWGNKPRLQAQRYSWDKIIPQYEQLLTTIV